MTSKTSTTQVLTDLTALLSQAPLDETSRSYLLQLLLETEADRTLDSILDLILPYLEDDEKTARVLSDQILRILPASPSTSTALAPKMPFVRSTLPTTETTTRPSAKPSSEIASPAAPPLAPAMNRPAEEAEESYDDVITGMCDSRGRFPPGLSRDVKVTISLAVGQSTLLERADLVLTYGVRYGLVGINGAGKSTLLDRIARGRIVGFPKHLRCMHLRQEIHGDERSILQSVLEADVELQRLQRREQELLAGNGSSSRAALTSSSGRREALKASAENLECSAEALEELQAIANRMEEIDADTAVGRATKLLMSMGFSNQALDTPTIKLSGGWRMRVSLACSLFLKPDVLLLDEPTNHLDLPSVVWLQNYLAENFDGTLVCVSHDRSFLDALCQHTIHLHKRQLVNYPCCFSEFLQARGEKVKSRAAMQAGIDAKRDHLRQSIKNIEAQARGNKQDQKRLQQVASRKKKINRVGAEKTADGKKFNAQQHGIRLGAINANEGGWDSKGHRTAGSVLEATDAEVRFCIPSAPPVAAHAALLTMSNVSYAYPERPDVPVVRDVNLRLDSGSRLVLLGANGSGKTTLMRLLAGELQPAKGSDIRRAPNLRVAYFTQHFSDALPADSTPLQHAASHEPALRHLLPADGSPLSLSVLTSSQHQVLRAHLSAFGLQGDIVNRKICTLSGGQKSRLTLAALTLEAPHLLLLDEPSNHLDFLSIKALASALRRYRGALVLVSHDQWLVEQLLGQDTDSGSEEEEEVDDEDNPRPETEIMVVSKGRARRFESDFATYRASLLAEKF